MPPARPIASTRWAPARSRSTAARSTCRPAARGYQRNTRYTILNADGGVTGSFTEATTNLAFLTPTLIYEGNAVLLNLQASDALSYASVARTANQAAGGPAPRQLRQRARATRWPPR